MSSHFYYVNSNAQNNGDHEVHTDDCKFLPSEENKVYLGYFSNCKEAVKKAKELNFTTANGCYFCCNECHTS